MLLHGKSIPTLLTLRLILRPFHPLDAVEVQRLAGEREVAATTLRIPHPYQDGMAEAWISTHQHLFELDKQVNFAIVRRQDDALLGAIGLVFDFDHEHAEVGYWLGRAFWGCGYCTEAAGRVLQYGFEERRLHRIFGHYMSTNPASGRVMAKLGMKPEGTLRQHVMKWGRHVDIEQCGILREEWMGGNRT